jgi:magnesium transporter
MLINCVAYEKGTKISSDIPVEDISDYIAKEGCFVWVALKDATEAELSQMQEEFGLHELAVEDARHGHQRPKVEEYGDSLFVVMHLIERSERSPHQLHIGEVHLFVGENYVLSVRNHSDSGFLGVRKRCENEPHLLKMGSGFVLYALMDAVVDRYFPIIDALEVELEEIERQIFEEGSVRQNTKRLYDLKRRVMTVKHAVAPLAEAAGKMHGGRVPAILTEVQDYFRDVVDHLQRIQTSIDSMTDTIGTAINVNFSMVAIQEAEISKRLTAWAAIFAASTAFTGIWGMNFEFMPELKWRYGYPLALLIIGSTCGYLYHRFRKSGWL